MTDEPQLMTDEEYRAALERYVVKWQPLLGLQNWHIAVVVTKDVLSNNVLADIAWTPHYRHATMGSSIKHVTFHEIDFAEEHIERTAVHELCHLLLAPIRDVIHNQFDGESFGWLAFKGRQETVVDELTNLILRLYKG